MNITTKVNAFIANPTLLNFLLALWPQQGKSSLKPELVVQYMLYVYDYLEALEDDYSRVQLQLAIIKCIHTISPTRENDLLELLDKMYDRLEQKQQSPGYHLTPVFNLFYVETAKLNQSQFLYKLNNGKRVF